MTVREIYDSVVIEKNKEDSQSFTVEEFNYVLNKAVLAFLNEKYNFYSANQQLSDDLRVFVRQNTFNVDNTDVGIDLSTPVDMYNDTTSYCTTDLAVGTLTITTSSAKDLSVSDTVRIGKNIAQITAITTSTNTVTINQALTSSVEKGTVVQKLADTLTIQSASEYGSYVDVKLASSNYLHILGCSTTWAVRQKTGAIVNITSWARRLTIDTQGAIQNNTYLKPSPTRPYYRVFDNDINVGVLNMGDDFTFKEYNNKPVIRVFIGESVTSAQLKNINISFLTLPEKYTLNEEEVYTYGQDTSQVLQLPSYLKNEIVKRCVIYLLEKQSNPRIQTHPVFNQEIPQYPINMGYRQPAARLPEENDKQQR